MELSYIKLLDNIKMSLFSGDHSGIYMLVCAAACQRKKQDAGQNHGNTVTITFFHKI